MIEGGHKIELQWEGNVAEEHWGLGMWQWHKLLLGGSPVIDFHLGNRMESQQGFGLDLWPAGWQGIGIGEEWDWSSLWAWGAEMKKWILPKF